MASLNPRTVGTVVLAVLLVAGLAVGGIALLQRSTNVAPLPGQDRCVATAAGRTVVLEVEQAHYAAIIVGLSVRRGLPPRAGSIAMATVYQETGIQNLDYGDRDSVGLFQQRPSQGWGTQQQLRDPYYATNKFYDALVKIKDWQQGDINDVAQQVQRSGHPEAYRDHEQDARVLASALTGQFGAALTCLDRSTAAGNVKALARSLRQTFGPLDSERSGRSVTVRADSAELAWAYGHNAVANAGRYGVVEVVVGKRHWRSDGVQLPEWTSAANPLKATEVQVTVR